MSRSPGIAARLVAVALSCLLPLHGALACTSFLLAASDGVADPVPTDDRLEASLATATWAMAQGAAMIRVHDVRASLQAAKVVAA